MIMAPKETGAKSKQFIITFGERLKNDVSTKKRTIKTRIWFLWLQIHP